MVIYKIKNKINGKIYIGQTKFSIATRWTRHLEKGSFCRLLKFAIRKYGKENFEISVLCRCKSVEEMNQRERSCIRLFNSMAPNGYNLTSGGGNRVVGEETRKRMSKSQTGIPKPQSKEHSANIAKSLTGKKLKLSTRIKMSESRSQKMMVVETGKIFGSIKDAAKNFGVSNTTIIAYLNGRRKNSFGLTFMRL